MEIIFLISSQYYSIGILNEILKFVKNLVFNVIARNYLGIYRT